jgi:hypothetical protein
MTANRLKQARREYERALTALFGLLIHCGVGHKSILVMADHAFKSAVAKTRDYRMPGGDELANIGLVLDAWHRDRRYLTSKGKPRAVPLLGRVPSVEALIRTQGRHLDAIGMAHRIRSLELIRSCFGNRYRPIGDAALVSTYGPTVLHYVARCLTSLLDTVEHNIRGVPDRLPLLERTAEVPTLPVEYLESFRKFSESQGSVFMRTINDWLETRRVRAPVAGAHTAVRAGVHLYVFVSPHKPQSRARLPAKRSKSSI